MRLIEHTGTPCQLPWPDDCKVQGGARGVVFQDAGKRTYRTAFVEAFPREPDTFLRGEGKTIEEAERACWEQYQTLVSCEHGPYERRQYRNGAGFCVKCDTWFPGVFEPLPEDPARAPSLLEKALLGDIGALGELLESARSAREGAPPDGPAGTGTPSS